MDYYNILGVSKNSTSDEIKKAFRQMAVKFHPDKNQGDKASEEQFKKINEAYEVLGDPEKKKLYDLTGSTQQRRQREPQGFGAPFGMPNMNDFFWGGGQENVIRPVTVTVRLSLFDVATGVKKKISYSSFDPCGKCSGSGVESGTTVEKCAVCNGVGQVGRINGFMQFVQTCAACNGRGKKFVKCKSCNGVGRLSTEKNIEVEFPCGIADNMGMRLSGKGNWIKEDKYSELLIQVQVLPHDFFNFKENDVYCTVYIPFKTAIVGGEIDVPTIYGKGSLTIPPSTSGDSVFKLSKMGIPQVGNSSVKGDMFVKVQIDVPTGISNDFMEKIRSLPDEGLEYKFVKMYLNKMQDIEKDVERAK